MEYYLDASKISLDELQIRIIETDLVPSRRLLLTDIKENFATLKSYGFINLHSLRKELKNAKNIPLVSELTDINTEYLKLLRREIESFFPKAFPIKSFSWIAKEDIRKLEKHGYNNTVKLFDALCTYDYKNKMSEELAISKQVLKELSCLVSLVRIQWISPMAAKMLFSIGYQNVKEVAQADANIMCNELDKMNKEKGFFKGKIGLRDVRRLIKAASYIGK